MTEETKTYNSIFVARQPIFDQEMNIWGFELLFRDSDAFNQADFVDSNFATSQVIVDGLAIAQEDLKLDKKILINFPKSLILDGTPFALPQGHVIELLEDIPPEKEVVDQCKTLKNDYLLAVDDYIGQEGCEPLLEQADIIKVDVLGMSNEKMTSTVSKLKPLNRILLAEKVETLDCLNLSKQLGFSLFQGFFFQKPQLLSGRKLSTNQMSRLNLLKELGKKDFDSKSLSSALETDVSLSYRLLKYINSPGFGLVTRINSIQHAINLLGENKIKHWLRVLLLADMNPSERGQELVRQSVIRGKFLQLLAESESTPLPPETMFMIGLFSSLDAILDQPMEEVLKKLPLEDSIQASLLGDSTETGLRVDLAKSLETADLKRIHELSAKLDQDTDKIADYYWDATHWSRELLNETHQAEP